ncbi:Myosin-2 essential light chain [Diplonema papillatum]|nr:Myosin-2 essential light chain [Diplonema papillatum]
MGDEAKWVEIWNLFDNKGVGSIPKVDFLACVRVLGRKYTEKDMNDKTAKLPDPVPKDAFLAFMREPYTGPTLDDLKRALEAFDGKECGSLPVSQINMMLKGMGDKLTDDEAAQILEGLPQEAGQVNIEKMIEFLNPPLPSTSPNMDELRKEIEAEEEAKLRAAGSS